MAIIYAPLAHQLLKGVFAVYKPTTTPISSILSEIYDRILKDLNEMKQQPQKQMIVFKPPLQIVQNFTTEINPSKSGNVPVLVPDWFDHPLVQGNRYKKDDITLHLGHALDAYACGVQVVGIGKFGQSQISHLKKLSLPRRYRAKGQFGQASLSHSTFSKIVDRSTYDHITDDKIVRLLALIQGAHRNACIKASGVDLCSQKAYELASKGLLKPQTVTDPIILELKLVSFNPPEFVIDATVINESCLYVRRIIHDVGYKLRSAAVCTHLQRLTDGPFTHVDPHTLLGHQVNANSVIESISHFQSFLDKGFFKPRKHFRLAKPSLDVNKNLKLNSGNTIDT